MGILEASIVIILCGYSESICSSLLLQPSNSASAIRCGQVYCNHLRLSTRLKNDIAGSCCGWDDPTSARLTPPSPTYLGSSIHLHTGEWPRLPLLRASNEHSFTVRVLRARRAPGCSLSLLLYVEPLSDARTQRAAIFNILACGAIPASHDGSNLPASIAPLPLRLNP